MKMRLLHLGSLGALALLVGMVLGCSDETKERKACPTGGLGVTSSGGKKCSTLTDPNDDQLKDCNAQLEKFDDYNCTKPQACPDNGYFTNIYYLDATWPGETINFGIANCSVGDTPLTISNVELLGDARCSFKKFDFNTNVIPKVVEAGGPETASAIIQVVFRPSKLGEDHAALKVTTSAENFPTMILPICFKVVPNLVAGADSGPKPPVPDGGVQSWLKGFRCKDMSSTPRVCP